MKFKNIKFFYVILLSCITFGVLICTIKPSSLYAQVASGSFEQRLNDFSHNTVSKFLTFASNHSAKQFKEFTHSKLKQFLAVKYMALWSLGSIRFKFNTQQLTEYTNLFAKYIANFYSNTLYTNRKQNLAFKNIELLSSSQALLNYQVNYNNKQILISLKARENLNNKTIYITDFIVNGISFLQTQRERYASMFSKSGNSPDAFISLLKSELVSVKHSKKRKKA